MTVWVLMAILAVAPTPNYPTMIIEKFNVEFANEEECLIHKDIHTTFEKRRKMNWTGSSNFIYDCVAQKKKEK